MDVPDPVHRYDSMQVLQALIEIQKEVTANSTKTDRLIVDVGSLSTKVDDVREKISFVRGAVWVIGALIGILIVAAGVYLRFLW